MQQPKSAITDDAIFSLLSRPSFFEVDLDAVRYNVQQYKSLVGKNVDILIAIKGNAYGLGAAAVAEALANEDIYGFATGDIYEAVNLRKAGIDKPIQIFPGITENAAQFLRDYNIMPTFSSPGEARRYRDVLGPNTLLKVWLKCDTGLGRFGYCGDELLEELTYIQENTAFVVDGICSHIGPVDSDTNIRKDYYNDLQIERFTEIKRRVEAAGFAVDHYQLASAFATQRYENAWFNTICIGTSIYYAQNSKTFIRDLQLKMPVCALKSRLVSVKSFTAGDTCMDNVLDEDMRIGTIPLGMGDGLLPDNTGRDVLINGKRYPIYAVCLEHCLINLLGNENISLGDTVTLLGEDHGDCISLKEICDYTKCQDIKLPIVRLHFTSLPYVYISGGKPVKIVVAKENNIL